ncbi:1-deoxy-D-xylulose-5-phosphate reductoisomerase [Methylohalomonas lacus]|uniref:1-deoxy-D-xylulose 5-phosphate reductoisomerase n=1 Tax=Methylohalomonas lacus TaxID=398773 RepID=A0AAE3HJR4_9GAMM|nr:1-deoxy-D-xylulose-5-phosphate reductoisomerase [Methylohalomonas lacus]MCS3902523.1 1-deoxy-D-xylulose-5-phosphate reductoisomerase [Methylohalomonas lacus]
MIGVTILGATGTIGLNTLDVIGRHPDRYRVVALTANRDVERMAGLCRQWQPAYAVMADADAAEQLRQQLGDCPQVQVRAGNEALAEVAALDETDYVMAAIVGGAGLLPTLAAARAGKRVLLANKEALVMSGRLFMDAVRDHGAELLPIDSEHNAIFQCLPPDHQSRGLAAAGVERILLTASGGPFRDMPLDQLAQVTPDQACAHPNWVMGRKISVDSATMMNKGLEVIEACWLFDTTPANIQVVLHPQSVIHSLVQYCDGTVLAELGNPDMRTPIAHALAWPERVAAGVEALDLFAVARLDFQPPDMTRFPCLHLAAEAMHAGGTATAIMNAANEVAVEAFLDQRIRFTDIARVVEATLAQGRVEPATALETVLAADAKARSHAHEYIREQAA